MNGTGGFSRKMESRKLTDAPNLQQKLELTNTIQYIRFVLFGFGKISCQEHAN